MKINSTHQAVPATNGCVPERGAVGAGVGDRALTGESGRGRSFTVVGENVCSGLILKVEKVGWL